MPIDMFVEVDDIPAALEEKIRNAGDESLPVGAGQQENRSQIIVWQESLHN